jgi:Reverse transcriptase (RNA-dependent DNA polymerase)
VSEVVGVVQRSDGPAIYSVNEVRVLWAGLTTDCSLLNGVKQSAVISPILFCIHFDDLLLQLSQSGVGCFVVLHFVGALAYADDIVLIAPSPLVMRRLLAICNAYASEYDIEFNGSKSKILVIASSKNRSFYRDMCTYCLTISGQIIENVNICSHLGYIIT